ncbi:MAG: aminotransferase class I/II-fold pyridoxal phosphate-dependent enzyme [Salinivirgaceae bacterium]|jgi:dTDP-4-amino-4,6-dideoxygalactose transaminase|nr:aminotransferase class I/II-fold pyridoxal phosphate-dependent enzyme [Salinivirgaceae bacterium]
MAEKIFLSSPHMSGKEQNYVNEAFSSNWIAPLGPNVNGFEKELASYTQTKHAAALSSGTAALHLALINLGVKQGDEVLVSSFTFSATVNPIVYQGAVPVFIDSEMDTWNMDPEILKKAVRDRIEKGKKPAAIIIVHLYGMPAKMDEIMQIAQKYDIPIIEDAAEALGGQYKNKALGSMGDMGILSFNGNKIITTSGGGALISNNEKYITNARFLATQARDEAPHYQHSHIGYNYRMSNIVAGIGRGQLEVIDKRVSQRRTINQWYRTFLSDFDGITFLTEPNDQFFSNFWLTTILVDQEKCNGTSREDIRLRLLDYNIETRPLWKPMHLQPVFAKYPAYMNGTCERLFDVGLCLPSGSNLTQDQKDRIYRHLIEILKS